jgi:hypothetical protein
MQRLTTMVAPLPPRHPPWVTVLEQPQTQTGRSACRISPDFSSDFRLRLTGSNQSQSHVTTNSQLASLSRCQTSIWGPRPHFYYCQRVASLLVWDAPSDKKTGLLFTIAAAPLPAQPFLGLRPMGLMTIFYCLRFETPPTWRARSAYLCPPGTE